MTIAQEKLLGIGGDLFEVSLALEENIVPEYLIQQKLRDLFICLLLRIYIWNFSILFDLSRNRL